MEKATQAPAPRAFDGDKKLTGLKRHGLVDVGRRLLTFGFSKGNRHVPRRLYAVAR
jgi:hypothetical protein